MREYVSDSREASLFYGVAKSQSSRGLRLHAVFRGSRPNRASQPIGATGGSQRAMSCRTGLVPAMVHGSDHCAHGAWQRELRIAGVPACRD
jgi:hypothetical protein